MDKWQTLTQIARQWNIPVEALQSWIETDLLNPENNGISNDLLIQKFDEGDFIQWVNYWKDK